MSGLIRRVTVRFVGLRDVDDSQNGVITIHRTCAARNNLPTLLAGAERADYFLPRAVALLIRVAALLASASFSKPNSAEYLRPTTCAITKLMLIRASPTALAIAWPSPGRLSPSTSRVEMDDGARPAVCAAATDFLPEIGCSSIAV